MRASTLFALTAAILIGLGVAVSAKLTGFFARPAEPAKRPEVQILVASRNLFAGDTLTASDVRLRPIKQEEADHFASHRDQYLPAVQAAAALRVPKVNIEADAPVLRTQLKEMVKPEALNERLMPQMRAVNLVLPKERSGGGLIQVGEWVEVLLTSDIAGSDGNATTRTAVIAPKVKIIAKRDTLWPIFAPLPKDKPVEYTMEVNAYRAALIEYCRTKGNISILSLPQSEQKKFDAERKSNVNGVAANNTQAVARTEEDADEEQMVQATESGQTVIGDADLAAIFDLKQPVDESKPPPMVLTTIQRVVGTRYVESAAFTATGKPTSPMQMQMPIGPAGSRSIFPIHMRSNLGNNNALNWKFNVPTCPGCPPRRR